jgi:hypothetical protein
VVKASHAGQTDDFGLIRGSILDRAAFSGEVKAGREFDLGGLLRLKANGSLGLRHSRSSFTSLKVDWGERGRPTVELQEQSAKELTLSIAASVGATLTKAGKEKLTSEIERYLEEWNDFAMVDEATEKGVGALEKAIAEYLNASVNYGFSHTDKKRETIVCGPFDLDQESHREAFMALRRDYNLLLAIEAGLLQVRRHRRERIDESTLDLNLFKLLKTGDKSFDGVIREEGEFEMDGIRASMAGVDVSGRESADFDFFIEAVEEAISFQWKGASVIARKEGEPRPAGAVLLYVRGTLEDGEVEPFEARRWRMLLEHVFPKVDLVRFEEGRGSGKGKGTLGFQLNRQGLRNLLEIPLADARRVFLNHAVSVQGSPGAPPCALPEVVPLTWRSCRLLGWADQAKAARAFASEYGRAFSLDDVREARHLLATPSGQEHYTRRFGVGPQRDVVRRDSIERLEKFESFRRRKLHKPKKEAAIGYVRATKRNHRRFDPPLGQSLEVAALDFRMLEQADEFVDTLFDVQTRWQERGAAGTESTDLHQRMFQRFSDFAHEVTPDSLLMVRARPGAGVRHGQRADASLPRGSGGLYHFRVRVRIEPAVVRRHEAAGGDRSRQADQGSGRGPRGSLLGADRRDARLA